MSLTCAVVQDLLPIYVEKAASEETDQLIEEHLKQCEACRHMHVACQVRLRKKQKSRKRLTPNMLIEDSLMKQIQGQNLTFRMISIMGGALMGFYVILTAGTWFMSLVYGIIGAISQILIKRPWPAPLFALATTLIYSGFVNPDPVSIPGILLRILVNMALAFIGGIAAFFITSRRADAKA
jgi:predicted anti-sigma-YlaC factor YlaD